MRCLVRNRGGSRARALEDDGFELHEGDVLRPETLRGAGRRLDAAYYLIHSMGRRGPKEFASRERAAAIAFGRMACEEGIERVIYLGGLGDRPHSPHLGRPRPRTGRGPDGGRQLGASTMERVSDYRHKGIKHTLDRLSTGEQRSPTSPEPARIALVPVRPGSLWSRSDLVVVLHET